MAKKKQGLTAAELETLRTLLAKAAPEPQEKPAAPRIEVPRVKGGRKIKNTKRAFWTDGENAYLRRKRANPAIIERTDSKVKTGEYTHVRTSDDVQVYEIAEWSKLKRKALNLTEMSMKTIERHIVKAACAEDWKLYYDAVSEYAHRHKDTDLPQGTSQLMYQQSMAYLEHRIMRRGGPTPMRIQAELSGIRQARTKSRLYLPQSRH